MVFMVLPQNILFMLTVLHMYFISFVCLFVGSYSQGAEYWIKSDPLFYLCYLMLLFDMDICQIILGKPPLFLSSKTNLEITLIETTTDRLH